MNWEVIINLAIMLSIIAGGILIIWANANYLPDQEDIPTNSVKEKLE